MIYVSYHNIDIDYAFQLATLLIRYYRNIWLDRFEICPTDDWNAKIGDARNRATGVIVIVSDDYLHSPYCRAEFEAFEKRGIAVTAVIPRDFSTDTIADFTFSDWIDFRRWFDDPNDISVENLLSQIPQSEAVGQTGERLDYLRSFLQEHELALATMPTSWASLRNADAAGSGDIRPRGYTTDLLGDWHFAGVKAGNSLPVDDLLQWAESEPQFILRGATGSGKTCFARLLTLERAHAAIDDDQVAVPIWLDLALWDESHHSVEAFIEAQWPLLSYWKHWLENQRACIVLDNWNELYARNQAYAQQVSNWIDASPNLQFLLLSRQATGADPKLPMLRINPLSGPSAQQFAGSYLTLDQQNSFRQILRQKTALIESGQLDYLAIGFELLSADRALAFNQWQQNPMQSLISGRMGQHAAASNGLHVEQVLAALQGLAWTMMLQDTHRIIDRHDATKQAGDERIINCSLAIGLLSASGDQLRFSAEIYQWYLAAENFKRDGMVKYLTRPEFSAAHGRIPRKWDALVMVVCDSLSDANRLSTVDRIADIDPFLASVCLRRHPEVFGENHESLLTKLVTLCAQNPAAQTAFRGAISDLPDPNKTAELLIGQMSRFGNTTQLWLWHEIRALPLELPLNFLDIVANLYRDSSESAAEMLADYRLALSVAYLVKLSAHEDDALRRNAIWIIGELKYLPTAILLLDYLEADKPKDADEVVLALMKFAYSEILSRVLRWSNDHPGHRPAVIAALAKRKRLVTSTLLAMADAKRLTLNPQFYDLLINTAEADMAIGLAQIASQHLELPQSVETAIMTRKNAEDLRDQLAAAIKQLPNRVGFQRLLKDIEAILQDPPEATVIAGSKLGALLYGQPLFDDFAAQAEAEPTSGIPEDLQQQLRQSDWQQRHRALNSLSDYPARAALPHLLAMTDDEDRRVRLAAYEILSQYGTDQAAQKAVIAALADSDAEIVSAVTELLKSSSAVEFDAIVDLLDSENALTAAAAIDILAHARYQAALPEMRQLLGDNRRAAGEEKTIGERARLAIAAIESPGEILEGATTPPDTGPAPPVGQTRDGFSDEEKILRTLDVLRDDDWGRTQRAAKFLRKFAKHLRGSDNGHIVNLLCESLNDANWSVRWAVTEALAMLRNRAAAPHLRQLINDSSWIVQVAVVRTLVELAAADATGDMLPLLKSPHKQVREATAEALGELRDGQALEALSATLKGDGDNFVRLAALKAICQIEPPEMRAFLEYALSDGDIHLRWYAMTQLAPRMDETDLPLLQQLLTDDAKPSWEEETLRDLAIGTLQRIDSAECRALLASLHLADERDGA